MFYAVVFSLTGLMLFITNIYIVTALLLVLIITAYLICKIWVFDNRFFEMGTLLKEVPLFLISSSISVLVYSGILWFGLVYIPVSTWELPFIINVMPMLPAVISMIVNIIAVMASFTLNYIGVRFIFNKFRKEELS